MKRIMLALRLLLLTGCFSSEQTLAISEVPQLVIDAALAEVPGLEIEEASTETEDGILIYEIEGTANGMEYEIEISATGEILEVESEKDDD